jgi:hypothetical protein
MGTTNNPSPQTPEAIVEQLRAVRANLVSVRPMTAKQRKKIRGQSEMSVPVLQASINIIGMHDTIERAVDRPIDEVRELENEWGRWTAVEDELRTLLNGVSGANLARRQELTLIASQAYAVGTQLARSPANDFLVPHVLKIRQLRKLAAAKRKGKKPEGTEDTGEAGAEPAPPK